MTLLTRRSVDRETCLPFREGDDVDVGFCALSAANRVCLVSTMHLSRVRSSKVKSGVLSRYLMGGVCGRGLGGVSIVA
jgi:hypothetical protein